MRPTTRLLTLSRRAYRRHRSVRFVSTWFYGRLLPGPRGINERGTAAWKIIAPAVTLHLPESRNLRNGIYATFHRFRTGSGERVWARTRGIMCESNSILIKITTDYGFYRRIERILVRFRYCIYKYTASHARICIVLLLLIKQITLQFNSHANISISIVWINWKNPSLEKNWLLKARFAWHLSSEFLLNAYLVFIIFLLLFSTDFISFSSILHFH